MRGERETSNKEDMINDFDPKRYTNKEYFLKMADLYNNLMFTFRPKKVEKPILEDSKELMKARNSSSEDERDA